MNDMMDSYAKRNSAFALSVEVDALRAKLDAANLELALTKKQLDNVKYDPFALLSVNADLQKRIGELHLESWMLRRELEQVKLFHPSLTVTSPSKISKSIPNGLGSGRRSSWSSLPHLGPPTSSYLSPHIASNLKPYTPEADISLQVLQNSESPPKLLTVEPAAESPRSGDTMTEQSFRILLEREREIFKAQIISYMDFYEDHQKKLLSNTKILESFVRDRVLDALNLTNLAQNRMDNFSAGIQLFHSIISIFISIAYMNARDGVDSLDQGANLRLILDSFLEKEINSLLGHADDITLQFDQQNVQIHKITHLISDKLSFFQQAYLGSTVAADSEDASVEPLPVIHHQSLINHETTSPAIFHDVSAVESWNYVANELYSLIQTNSISVHSEGMSKPKSLQSMIQFFHERERKIQEQGEAEKEFRAKNERLEEQVTSLHSKCQFLERELSKINLETLMFSHFSETRSPSGRKVSLPSLEESPTDSFSEIDLLPAPLLTKFPSIDERVLFDTGISNASAEESSDSPSTSTPGSAESPSNELNVMSNAFVQKIKLESQIMDITNKWNAERRLVEEQKEALSALEVESARKIQRSERALEDMTMAKEKLRTELEFFIADREQMALEMSRMQSLLAMAENDRDAIAEEHLLMSEKLNRGTQEFAAYRDFHAASMDRENARFAEELSRIEGERNYLSSSPGLLNFPKTDALASIQSPLNVEQPGGSVKLVESLNTNSFPEDLAESQAREAELLAKLSTSQASNNQLREELLNLSEKFETSLLDTEAVESLQQELFGWVEKSQEWEKVREELLVSQLKLSEELKATKNTLAEQSAVSEKLSSDVRSLSGLLEESESRSTLSEIELSHSQERELKYEIMVHELRLESAELREELAAKQVRFKKDLTDQSAILSAAMSQADSANSKLLKLESDYQSLQSALNASMDNENGRRIELESCRSELMDEISRGADLSLRLLDVLSEKKKLENILISDSLAHNVRVSALEKDISTINLEKAELTQLLSSAQTSLISETSSYNSQLSALKREIKSLDQEKAELKSQLADTQASISSKSTAHKAQVTTLEREIEGQKRQESDLKLQLICAQEAIASKASGYNIHASALEKEIEALKLERTELARQLESAQKSFESQSSTLNLEVATLEKKCEVLEQGKTELIRQLRDNNDALERSSLAHHSDVNGLETRIDLLNLEKIELTRQLAETQNTLADHLHAQKSQVSALKKDIDTLNLEKADLNHQLIGNQNNLTISLLSHHSQVLALTKDMDVLNHEKIDLSKQLTNYQNLLAIKEAEMQSQEKLLLKASIQINDMEEQLLAHQTELQRIPKHLSEIESLGAALKASEATSKISTSQFLAEINELKANLVSANAKASLLESELASQSKQLHLEINELRSETQASARFLAQKDLDIASICSAYEMRIKDAAETQASILAKLNDELGLSQKNSEACKNAVKHAELEIRTLSAKLNDATATMLKAQSEAISTDSKFKREQAGFEADRQRHEANLSAAMASASQERSKASFSEELRQAALAECKQLQKKILQLEANNQKQQAIYHSTEDQSKLERHNIKEERERYVSQAESILLERDFTIQKLQRQIVSLGNGLITLKDRVIDFDNRAQLHVENALTEVEELAASLISLQASRIRRRIVPKILLLDQVIANSADRDYDSNEAGDRDVNYWERRKSLSISRLTPILQHETLLLQKVEVLEDQLQSANENLDKQSRSYRKLETELLWALQVLASSSDTRLSSKTPSASKEFRIIFRNTVLDSVKRNRAISILPSRMDGVVQTESAINSTLTDTTLNLDISIAAFERIANAFFDLEENVSFTIERLFSRLSRSQDKLEKTARAHQLLRIEKWNLESQLSIKDEQMLTMKGKLELASFAAVQASAQSEIFRDKSLHSIQSELEAERIKIASCLTELQEAKSLKAQLEKQSYSQIQILQLELVGCRKHIQELDLILKENQTSHQNALLKEQNVHEVMKRSFHEASDKWNSQFESLLKAKANLSETIQHLSSTISDKELHVKQLESQLADKNDAASLERKIAQESIRKHETANLDLNTNLSQTVAILKLVVSTIQKVLKVASPEFPLDSTIFDIEYDNLSEFESRPLLVEFERAIFQLPKASALQTKEREIHRLLSELNGSQFSHSSLEKQITHLNSQLISYQESEAKLNALLRTKSSELVKERQSHLSTEAALQQKSLEVVNLQVRLEKALDEIGSLKQSVKSLREDVRKKDQRLVSLEADAFGAAKRLKDAVSTDDNHRLISQSHELTLNQRLTDKITENANLNRRLEKFESLNSDLEAKLSVTQQELDSVSERALLLTLELKETKRTLSALSLQYQGTCKEHDILKRDMDEARNSLNILQTSEVKMKAQLKDHTASFSAMLKHHAEELRSKNALIFQQEVKIAESSLINSDLDLMRKKLDDYIAKCTTKDREIGNLQQTYREEFGKLQMQHKFDIDELVLQHQRDVKLMEDKLHSQQVSLLASISERQKLEASFEALAATIDNKNKKLAAFSQQMFKLQAIVVEQSDVHSQEIRRLHSESPRTSPNESDNPDTREALTIQIKDLKQNLADEKSKQEQSTRSFETVVVHLEKLGSLISLSLKRFRDLYSNKSTPLFIPSVVSFLLALSKVVDTMPKSNSFESIDKLRMSMDALHVACSHESTNLTTAKNLPDVQDACTSIEPSLFMDNVVEVASYDEQAKRERTPAQLKGMVANSMRSNVRLKKELKTALASLNEQDNLLALKENDLELLKKRLTECETKLEDSLLDFNSQKVLIESNAQEKLRKSDNDLKVLLQVMLDKDLVFAEEQKLLQRQIEGLEKQLSDLQQHPSKLTEVSHVYVQCESEIQANSAFFKSTQTPFAIFCDSFTDASPMAILVNSETAMSPLSTSHISVQVEQPPIESNTIILKPDMSNVAIQVDAVITSRSLISATSQTALLAAKTKDSYTQFVVNEYQSTGCQCDINLSLEYLDSSTHSTVEVGCSAQTLSLADMSVGTDIVLMKDTSTRTNPINFSAVGCMTETMYLPTIEQCSQTTEIVESGTEMIDNCTSPPRVFLKDIGIMTIVSEPSKSTTPLEIPAVLSSPLSPYITSGNKLPEPISLVVNSVDASPIADILNVESVESAILPNSLVTGGESVLFSEYQVMLDRIKQGLVRIDSLSCVDKNERRLPLSPIAFSAAKDEELEIPPPTVMTGLGQIIPWQASMATSNLDDDGVSVSVDQLFQQETEALSAIPPLTSPELAEISRQFSDALYQSELLVGGCVEGGHGRPTLRRMSYEDIVEMSVAALAETQNILAANGSSGFLTLRSAGKEESCNQPSDEAIMQMSIAALNETRQLLGGMSSLSSTSSSIIQDAHPTVVPIFPGTPFPVPFATHKAAEQREQMENDDDLTLLKWAAEQSLQSTYALLAEAGGDAKGDGGQVMKRPRKSVVPSRRLSPLFV